MPLSVATQDRIRREAGQTWSFRGSKSRNKVSVGEPAEGSFVNDLHGLQPFHPRGLGVVPSAPVAGVYAVDHV